MESARHPGGVLEFEAVYVVRKCQKEDMDSMKRTLLSWGWGFGAAVMLLLGGVVSASALSDMDKLEDEMTIEALEAISFEDVADEQQAVEDQAQAQSDAAEQSEEQAAHEQTQTEQADAASPQQAETQTEDVTQEAETQAEDVTQEAETEGQEAIQQAETEASDAEDSAGSDVPPQMVTLDAAAGKAQGLYSPVDFDHELHLATGSCTDCHHMYEETGTYQPCSNCHEPKVDAASPAMSLYNAYHNRKEIASCVGCHTQMQAGPTGCRDCHEVE